MTHKHQSSYILPDDTASVVAWALDAVQGSAIAQKVDNLQAKHDARFTLSLLAINVDDIFSDLQNA